MDVAAWYTLGVVLLVVATLVLTRIGPDLVFIGGLTLLIVAGVVSPQDALAGFANPGLITVGALYVVVAGLRETGGIYWVSQQLLGKPKRLGGAQLRLMTPVAAMSALLNNTPVVAMLIPAVSDWAKRNELPVSKLMLPLSYAAIFGGTITLIGTSTNLVINGLLIANDATPRLGLFDLAWVGVPCTLVGIVFILLSSRWLLPDRRPARSLLENPREYSVEMLVEAGGPLVGRSIEAAGLRSLPETYLVEIERGERIIPVVSPQERLMADDRLVFVGVVDSVVELQKIRGLSPATDQVFKLRAPRSERIMFEAVVSDSFPLRGQTIRAGQFRSRYDAVVIAVARSGRRINKKVGDIVLQAGDTLLLEARPNFAEQRRNSRDFFLISSIEGSSPPRHERALLAAGILLAMVAAVTFNLLSMLQASLLAACVMMVTRCVSGEVARRSLDGRVLLVIAAAFGLGQGLEATGAAAAIANILLGFAGSAPWPNLLMVYLMTAVFTALMTNNAAAVLMFPIALTLSQQLQVDILPFAVTIMFAASASFATPMGYQTNLMVYGPGGYRFSDYLRLGLPLNVLLGLITVLLIPLVWPF
ncbi:MAG: SLC13 family permease [Trueperaceae bacterium]|nr:SLC13 family permease [Trueperaceae bacterium]